jgi:hypothetical protein
VCGQPYRGFAPASCRWNTTRGLRRIRSAPLVRSEPPQAARHPSLSAEFSDSFALDQTDAVSALPICCAESRFMPKRQRTDLVAALNALLASRTFATWLLATLRGLHDLDDAVLRLRGRYQQETVVLVSVQFPEPIALLSHVMLRPVVAQCEMDEHFPLLGPDPWL